MLNLLARLIARRRDAGLAAENADLRNRLAEVRFDNLRYAQRAVAADRRGNEAQRALAQFRAGIAEAHAALAADNKRLRDCGLLAAADLIEHNINGTGLDFADAEDAAAHLRRVAAKTEVAAR
ncbi:hypothetical protein OHV05_24670 [Kitasatospora sp. NBC_00070]|uniref:hypothetical protein n=1 Tax=Kitasatospora sp. NBC_00070 TaxID=2975962 RepID=UPI003243CEAD